MSDELDALIESLGDILNNQKLPIKPEPEPTKAEEPKKAPEYVSRRSPVKEAFLAAYRELKVKDAYTIDDKYPLASTLVEYVTTGVSQINSGNGIINTAINNAVRLTALEPPEINSIEDLADTIDLRLVKQGINVEHIETQVAKDKKSLLLFFDDRLKPKIQSVKEMLQLFGEVELQQKADQRNEETGGPEGFYVLSLKPYSIDAVNAAKDASSDKPEDDPTLEVATSKKKMKFEEVAKLRVEALLANKVLALHEPYCANCGKLHEAKVKAPKDIECLAAYNNGFEEGRNYAFEQHKDRLNRIVEAETKAELAIVTGQRLLTEEVTNESLRDAESAGFNQGFASAINELKNRQIRLKTGKDYEVDLPGCSLALDEAVAKTPLQCHICEKPAVKLNEHEFNGTFCARHGTTLDRYSKACYDCHLTKEGTS